VKRKLPARMVLNTPTARFLNAEGQPIHAELIPPAVSFFLANVPDGAASRWAGRSFGGLKGTVRALFGSIAPTCKGQTGILKSRIPTVFIFDCHDDFRNASMGSTGNRGQPQIDPVVR